MHGSTVQPSALYGDSVEEQSKKGAWDVSSALICTSCTQYSAHALPVLTYSASKTHEPIPRQLQRSLKERNRLACLPGLQILYAPCDGLR